MLGATPRLRRFGAAAVLIVLFYFLTTSFYDQGEFATPSSSSSTSSKSLSDEIKAQTEWMPSKKMKNNCPSTPPNPPYVPHERDGFSYRHVKFKYPVESFTALPEASKRLPLPRIQYAFKEPSAKAETQRKERQEAVKKVFKKCWKAYKEKAWLADEVGPVSGEKRNPFGGWGATLIDNLDTLLIMGMEDEFEEAVVAATTKISFLPEDSTVHDVNVFETTIRHLGGLIAAYDLSGCNDGRLLAKAVEVGDMIYAALDTPTRMPAAHWDLHKTGEEQIADGAAVLAVLGSSTLEFIRLSQVTGDMRWYDAAMRISNLMHEQQMKTRLPGLFPVFVDLRTPDLTSGTQFSLGNLADSTFEYFGKSLQLLRGAEPVFRELYTRMVDAASIHLLFRPATPDKADILMSATYHVDGEPEYQGQHLACFIGGMFLLGGKLTRNNTHLSYGKQMTDGCIWAYHNSPSGIMPETFTMHACESLSPCTDAHKSPTHPFASVSDKRYLLRPEAIESVFYLYRTTGDTKLLDSAWEMFSAIDKYTSTDIANAEHSDVLLQAEEQGGKSKLEDSMQSFWMAETLKYFYLIFSGPEVVGLDGWVFNTEAHPFRVPG